VGFCVYMEQFEPYNLNFVFKCLNSEARSWRGNKVYVEWDGFER
jgi:hypothetical protein